MTTAELHDAAAKVFAVDPSQVPGAVEHRLERQLLEGGLIEFESAPAGWLTQDGEVRESDWRAYYYTARPACDACDGSGRSSSQKRPGSTVQCKACKGTGKGRRVRLPATSTILDAVCPKGGLPRWAEARGIEGAVRAIRMGELDPGEHTDEDAVERVRALRLGADRARDDAAERGINVHALLQQYMLTGEPPNPAEHPEEHHGYIRALTRWLIDVRPEPVAVEQLVVSVKDGYAGRLDLKARIGKSHRRGSRGRLVLYDAKTQERCAIYDSAHLQARLYERADIACGGQRARELRVVVFAADGEYREMPCMATQRTASAALAFYRQMKPIAAACASRNRLEREARTA